MPLDEKLRVLQPVHAWNLLREVFATAYVAVEAWKATPRPLTKISYTPDGEDERLLWKGEGHEFGAHMDRLAQLFDDFLAVRSVWEQAAREAIAEFTKRSPADPLERTQRKETPCHRSNGDGRNEGGAR